MREYFVAPFLAFLSVSIFIIVIVFTGKDKVGEVFFHLADSQYGGGGFPSIDRVFSKYKEEFSKYISDIFQVQNERL